MDITSYLWDASVQDVLAVCFWFVLAAIGFQAGYMR